MRRTFLDPTRFGASVSGIDGVRNGRVWGGLCDAFGRKISISSGDDRIEKERGFLKDCDGTTCNK
jgi:hypothetical protein